MSELETPDEQAAAAGGTSLTLVTGATGLVGHAIVTTLLARGRKVRALVRSVERARSILPEACELVAGDVTSPLSVVGALRGCDVVYHAAGLPEQWLADAKRFETVNVGGTGNVVRAAKAAGIRRMIYTSTIDVFPFRAGVEFDESTLDSQPKLTAYGRSKQAADAIVKRAVDDGLPAVLVHPSGVYGPGPAGSPGLTRAIAQMLRGEVQLLLPGSIPVVYAEDVGLGHVLAEEQGRIGERFILHESCHTLGDFACQVREIGGRGTVPPTLPAWVARAFATVSERIAGFTGKAPVVARGQVEFLQMHARPSSRHAQERLGWEPTPFRTGLRRTIAWLRQNGGA